MRFVRFALPLALVIAASGCGKHEAAAPPAQRAVLAQVVTPASATLGNIYSGEVRARHESDLAFRVGGKMVARHVDVGSVVRKGAALARLDPQDARLAVEAARSQFAAAAADHALAKAELDRYLELHAKSFVSKAVLDARQTAFNTTEARLEQTRAQLATAQNQSAYTELEADADGVITAVLAEPGQVVAAGQPVVRLARPEEKEVVIHVPESRLAELREAHEVLVALWTQPEKPYAGRVREISPNADPVTRTFTVKVSVLEPDPGVRLGMTANVLLGERSARQVITLPLAAVVQEDGRSSVWVVDPATRKVNPRPIEVGAYREDGVTVLSGLAAGEVVVAAGAHKLLPGETVRLAPEVEAAIGVAQTPAPAPRHGG
jgi:multidrug efflux system membrane fusion protein